MKKIALALVVVFCVSSMAFAWPWSKKGTEEAKGKTMETKTKTTMMQKKTTKKGTMMVKKTTMKKKVMKKKTMPTK